MDLGTDDRRQVYGLGSHFQLIGLDEGKVKQPIYDSSEPLRALLGVLKIRAQVRDAAGQRGRQEVHVAAQAGLSVGYWSPWIIADCRFELDRQLPHHKT